MSAEVTGERGTGKELVADALQAASPRRDRPYVKVNCAALPAELVMKELFGHERGAFTGATDRALGLLRAAGGGTLFLDEIGDLSSHAQAALLRFLQEREVRPVGSVVVHRVNVRVLAATNKSLPDAVAQGHFRTDLYDRVAEVVLLVPPLRDRREDLPLLVDHFLDRARARHATLEPFELGAEVLDAIRRHTWPGNVRELEQAVNRAVILRDAGLIGAPHLQSDEKHFPEMTKCQREAVQIVWQTGAVRRRDLTRKLGMSRSIVGASSGC